MTDDETSRKAREILEQNGIEEPEESKGRGPSQAAQLVAIARKRYELFMSEDGRPYGVKVDGANIALPLRGRPACARSSPASTTTSRAGPSPPSRRWPTR